MFRNIQRLGIVHSLCVALFLGAVLAGMLPIRTASAAWDAPTVWKTETDDAVIHYIAGGNQFLVATNIGRVEESRQVAERILGFVGGLTPTGYTAAAYFDKQVFFTNQTRVWVDGTSFGTARNNFAYFAENSLVAFNAQNLTNDTFMQGNIFSGVNIRPDSTLMVVNPVEGQTIKVLADFYPVSGVLGIANWQNGMVFTNRMFSDSILDGSGGNYSIDVVRASAAESFAGLSASSASMVDRLFTSGLNDIESANAGIRYISRAVDQLYGDTGGNAVALAMESFGQLGAVAGVHTTTYHIGQDFADLMVTKRPEPAARRGCGFSLWATPFYTYVDMDGMKAGSVANALSSKYGGAVVGGEYAPSESIRTGMALTVGTGHNEGKGAFRKTTSDFNFWGVGGYAAFVRERFSLTSDLGYTGASHTVRQRIDPAMGMDDLKSSVGTGAYSLGVTGEYRFAAFDGRLDIIPRAGARFTTLRTGNYRVKTRNGESLSRVNAADQHLWTFPVAVTFTGEVHSGECWSVRPLADVGADFAAGDTGVRSRTTIAGTALRDTFHADVVDRVTFNGALGVQASARNGLNLRLDYTFKASRNLTSHGLNLMVGRDW